MHHAILGGVNFQFFSPEALIPFAPYMQNPSSFRPQGAILRAPSHTKLGFAIPLFHLYQKISLSTKSLIMWNLGQGPFDIKDFVWTLYKNKEDWDHSS